MSSIYDRQTRLWGTLGEDRLKAAQCLVFGTSEVLREICWQLGISGIGGLHFWGSSPDADPLSEDPSWLSALNTQCRDTQVVRLKDPIRWETYAVILTSEWTTIQFQQVAPKLSSSTLVLL